MMMGFAASIRYSIWMAIDLQYAYLHNKNKMSVYKICCEIKMKHHTALTHNDGHTKMKYVQKRKKNQELLPVYWCCCHRYQLFECRTTFYYVVSSVATVRRQQNWQQQLKKLENNKKINENENSNTQTQSQRTIVHNNMKN